MEAKEILSLGTVLYLKNNHQKMMVLSRGAIYRNEEGEEEFFDYLACIYPKGLEHDKAVFFNSEDIDKVIFLGYSDEEDIRVKELYFQWKRVTDIKQGTR